MVKENFPLASDLVVVVSIVVALTGTVTRTTSKLAVLPAVGFLEAFVSCPSILPLPAGACACARGVGRSNNANAKIANAATMTSTFFVLQKFRMVIPVSFTIYYFARTQVSFKKRLDSNSIYAVNFLPHLAQNISPV